MDEISNKPAGFFTRLLATFLDILIFLIIPAAIILAMIILTNLKIISMEDLKEHERIIDLLDYTYRILFLCFCIDCEASQKYQGTLGKYIMKIKIVTEDGSKISLPRAASRFIFKIISLLLLGIGFFMILFTHKKLGLHDMILNTKVVHR